MSKQPPTRTYCKRSRPLSYCYPNCMTPRHRKFTQGHRTTRPPPRASRPLETLSINLVVNRYLFRIREGLCRERRGMCSAFHTLWPRYSWPLSPTTATRLWGTFTTRYNSFKKQEDHEGLCRYADSLFQLMYCCFTFTVNSYGHVGVGGPRSIKVL